MDSPVSMASAESVGKPALGCRRGLYRAVFESDTRSGQLLDVVVIGAILLGIAVVVADSMPGVAARVGALSLAEWGFTALFTVE